jgi:predicted  nucleic acid-binding Zn-ribbon protein
MAESTGKSGYGESGHDRLDVREPITRPPPKRRDPRADPDDEPVSARVDVVQVDRTRPDPSSAVDALTNAALTLRRELARLHQQAAAVERTIEDQRRERNDALERVEAANARAAELERKLAQADAELTNLRRLHDTTLEELDKMRSERDDLARAIDGARAASEDLARLREQIEQLREARDEAQRTSAKYEAELAEIRKREQAGAAKVSDTETQLASLRERLERTTAELAQAREEAAQAKMEAVRLRQEASTATEAASKARDEAERERKTAKEQIERLERSLGEARVLEERLAVAESDLAKARTEAAGAKSELARLERDLEAARHAREVNLERATMAERETEELRKDVTRLQRELEAQSAATARAEARAAAAERAKSFVEDSVRQLRDELSTVFARWRTAAPSVPPSAEASQEASQQGPRKTTSFPPVTAEARPLSMPTPAAVPMPAPPATSPPPPLELDDDWSVAPNEVAAQSATPARGAAPAPLPAPPTGHEEGAPAPLPAPPTGHEEGAPARSVPPPLPQQQAPSVPPPLPTQRRSIPPAVYPSVPPPGTVSTPPTSLTPAAAPPPPSEESSVKILSKDRDRLLEELADPATSRDAAAELRQHPEWLRGRPPLELLTALTELDYDVDSPIFELARAWEREPIARALVAALRDEPEPKLREHAAWLLKHLGSPNVLPALADLVGSETEPLGVRRWLLEAVERLVTTRAIGWKEVGDLVSNLIHHSDPAIRDGVVGIVAALEVCDEKRKLLLELLRRDNDEIVLSSAVHALATVLPIELDPGIAERLLGHPSPRVQRSVIDFIERSKRNARSP